MEKRAYEIKVAIRGGYVPESSLKSMAMTMMEMGASFVGWVGMSIFAEKLSRNYGR